MSNPITTATAVGFQTGLGTIGLDSSFDPSTVTAKISNLSMWGTAVQIETPVFSSSVGAMGSNSTPVFFGAAVNTVFTGSSITANSNGTIYFGANAAAGTTLTIAGADNTLSGSGNALNGSSFNTSLVIGSPLANITGTGPNNNVNSTGTVVIQDSNNFTGGVLINKASTLVVQTGGVSGSYPLGAGTNGTNIEIFGSLTVQGATGSLQNQANDIVLRAGGTLTFDNNSAGVYTGEGSNGRAPAPGAAARALPSTEVRSACSAPPNLDVTQTIGAMTFSQNSTIPANGGFGTVSITPRRAGHRDPGCGIDRHPQHRPDVDHPDRECEPVERSHRLCPVHRGGP